MAAAAPIIGAIGAGLGGIASITQGVLASRAAGDQANRLQQAGAIESDRIRREGRRAVAARAARFGASGLTLTGTPLDVLADEAAEFEERAMIQMFGRQSEADAVRTQGRLSLISNVAQSLPMFAQTAAFGLEASTILGSGRTQPLGSSMRVINRP